MVSSNDGAERERFALLDGMRGLAALAVITDHVPSTLFTTLLPGRYLAVDFFFVLSGFVLAHVYSRRLTAGLSLLAFMRVRVVRLYPLYLLGAATGAVLMALHIVRGWNDASLAQLATSTLFALFMLPCPPPASLWENAPYPLNGPSWSLFFELFINLIFALVAPRLTPRLCLMIAGIGAILLVPTAFGFGQLDGGFAWSNFVAGFPRVTFSFFAGVFLYQTRSHWRLPALPAWAGYLALAAVFMVPATGVWRSLYDLVAVLILFPALVALCSGSDVRGAVAKVSSVAGTLSYGVYILHVPLWGWLQLVLGRLHLDLPGGLDVVLTAGAALAIAAVLHKIYDTPVRRWLSLRQTPRAALARD
ncbi:MAG: acyltransferase [Hyphomonadaceae bacterium]|nr:acyltransferase [Hyphomonadaceae bacterium]